MNVFSSAGNAARAQIELAGLFNQARKLTADNQLGGQMAQEKDKSAGKAQSLALQKADLDAQKAKTIMNYAKVGLAVLKLVGAAAAAGGSNEKGNSATEGQAAKTNPSDAAKSASNASAIVSSAIQVVQQVVAVVNNVADQEKQKKNRNTLKAEDAAISADMQQLDSAGKA